MYSCHSLKDSIEYHRSAHPWDEDACGIVKGCFMFPPQCSLNDPPDCAMVASFRLISYNRSCASYLLYIYVEICGSNVRRYYLFYSSKECSLPLANNCINTKMQLNIGSLKLLEIANDALVRTPIGTDAEYYITMYISRDNKPSADDLAFTCTNNQPKVFISTFFYSFIPC